ncbi:YjbH domain-containing protein [candidate division KSB1 bacterium]|nr:YjbH domain-containing protein [candidate division KSB1 bacterium]
MSKQVLARFFLCGVLVQHVYGAAQNTVYGYSGFVVTPTATILKDGELTGNIGRLPTLYADNYVAYTFDYTTFIASLGFMPFMEVSFGFVRPDNYQGGVGDRTMAMRFQVLREKKNQPALAFGLHDFFAISGLELEPEDAQHFAATYLVLTKQIPLPFLHSRLTLNTGYGFDVLPAKDDVLNGWFWGFQYSPIEQVHLLFEYDTVHYNAGIRYNLFSHLTYTLSFWQLQYMMHQFSFSIHLK